MVNRITMLSIALVMVLAACGAIDDDSASTGGQSTATIEHENVDIVVEERAIAQLQKRYRFVGPTTTILSRPLTRSEASRVLCVRNCASRSYYVVILEGKFDSDDPPGVPDGVSYDPYRYLGALIDPSTGRIGQTYASSSLKDVRVNMNVD